MYGVYRGFMSFAMRSNTNTLSTPDKLKRWKRGRSDLCLMCQEPNKVPRKSTLHHVLNNCEAFLDNRYKWRHDSVVTFILETVKENKPDRLKIYGDMEGQKINEMTIPMNIVVTAQRLDTVVIDKSTPQPTVWLFELSCSFE